MGKNEGEENMSWEILGNNFSKRQVYDYYKKDKHILLIGVPAGLLL